MKLGKMIKKVNNGYIAKCNYIKYYKKCKIDSKVILLESQQGKEYNGNIYYIAKELSNNEEYKDYTIYMSIIKEKFQDAVNFFKLKKIKNVKFIKSGTNKYYKIISSAKFLINDNTFLPFFIKKEGQVYLNTWHGTPLKSLGKKIKNDFHNIGNTQRNFIISDYLLYPNEYTKNHMVEDYMISNLCDNSIILEGYPRNTAFFDEELKKEVRRKYKLENKQVITYMPTWRGTLRGQNSNVQEMNLEYIFEEMDERLSENQILYVNLHPIEKATVDFSKYKKVKPFPTEYETYEFLNIADILITDYSSVFFDFMNTGKKIILYVYDKESYLEDRGLYIDLEDLPFPKVENMHDLIKEINSSKTYDDTEFKEKFCKYDRKEATKVLCEKVIKNKDVDIHVEKIEGNNKKNIFIFGGRLACNGITASLKNLINSLDKTKYNYYLLIDTNIIKQDLSQLQEISKYIDYYAIKGKMNLTIMQKIVFNLYKNNLISTKVYLKCTEQAYKNDINRIFSNIKIDSIIQFSGYGYKKILLFSQMKCNKIIYLHSDMRKEAKVRKNITIDLLKYAYSKYDKLAIVTEDLQESTKEILNVPEKIYVAHNLINYEKILKLSEKNIKFDSSTVSNITLKRLKEILEKPNKKFITIGRFSKEKGHERLIHSFEKLWEKDNSIYLIIIGGQGPEYENILEMVKNLNCKNNIIIIKYVSNPYAILKKCDYFILSSLYEGFGLVICEADILGKPVISTKCGGPEKFMEENGGAMVENSEEGIYNGLQLLYDDKIKPMNVDYKKYNEKAIEEFEKLLK